MTDRYPNTWALLGDTVSHWPQTGYARCACLFHAASFAREVQGCIAPGREVTDFMGVPMLKNSRQAMGILRSHLAEFDKGEEPNTFLITNGERYGALETIGAVLPPRKD
jgi:hypothetical protein